MLSPSLEDYLEELYRFSLSNDVVRVTDISRKLNVSLPSVSKALRKLKAGQYINYQRYGIINLTDKGRKTGNFLVERNKILQEFLTLICADCDIAAEAEAMEHYLSKETIRSIQLLVTFMQDHTTCYQIFLEHVANKEQE
jgi:DtxR family Mn-dependent transcriptional regulator